VAWGDPERYLETRSVTLTVGADQLGLRPQSFWKAHKKYERKASIETALMRGAYTFWKTVLAAGAAGCLREGPPDAQGLLQYEIVFDELTSARFTQSQRQRYQWSGKLATTDDVALRHVRIGRRRYLFARTRLIDVSHVTHNGAIYTFDAGESFVAAGLATRHTPLV
jgi:hypothetical protein